MDPCCTNHARYTDRCIICEMPVVEPEDCVMIHGYLCLQHLDEWDPSDQYEPVNKAWMEYAEESKGA